MIKVGVFEDHPVVLRSLVSFLSENKEINVAFTARNKAELYEKLENFSVDIMIIDLLGLDVRGLEIYEHLHKKYTKTNVISFTSLSSAILIENLLQAGVKGYVNKNQDIEDLLEAIFVVNKGHISLPEDYSFLLKKSIEPNHNSLSPREAEIVQLIAAEYTTSDIAKQLNISVNTVENHRKSIFTKLNVKNVAGMVREVSKLGYLS